MAAIISWHNKQLLSNKVESACIVLLYNCRNKASYPLKGKYRESSIIYKATLKSGDVAKHYYGCCKKKFKTRFYNHNQSFKFRRKCNATKLSKAFWQLKDTGQNPCIKWSMRPAPPLTIQELNGAISACQRNSPFSEQTQILL